MHRIFCYKGGISTLRLLRHLLLATLLTAALLLSQSISLASPSPPAPSGVGATTDQFVPKGFPNAAIGSQNSIQTTKDDITLSFVTKNVMTGIPSNGINWAEAVPGTRWVGPGTAPGTAKVCYSIWAIALVVPFIVHECKDIEIGSGGYVGGVLFGVCSHSFTKTVTGGDFQTSNSLVNVNAIHSKGYVYAHMKDAECNALKDADRITSAEQTKCLAENENGWFDPNATDTSTYTGKLAQFFHNAGKQASVTTESNLNSGSRKLFGHPYYGTGRYICAYDLSLAIFTLNSTANPCSQLVSAQSNKLAVRAGCYKPFPFTGPRVFPRVVKADQSEQYPSLLAPSVGVARFINPGETYDGANSTNVNREMRRGVISGMGASATIVQDPLTAQYGEKCRGNFFAPKIMVKFGYNYKLLPFKVPPLGSVSQTDMYKMLYQPVTDTPGLYSGWNGQEINSTKVTPWRIYYRKASHVRIVKTGTDSYSDGDGCNQSQDIDTVAANQDVSDSSEYVCTRIEDDKFVAYKMIPAEGQTFSDLNCKSITQGLTSEQINSGEIKADKALKIGSTQRPPLPLSFRSNSEVAPGLVDVRTSGVFLDYTSPSMSVSFIPTTINGDTSAPGITQTLSLIVQNNSIQACKVFYASRFCINREPCAAIANIDLEVKDESSTECANIQTSCLSSTQCASGQSTCCGGERLKNCALFKIYKRQCQFKTFCPANRLYTTTANTLANCETELHPDKRLKITNVGDLQFYNSNKQWKDVVCLGRSMGENIEIPSVYNYTPMERLIFARNNYSNNTYGNLMKEFVVARKRQDLAITGVPAAEVPSPVPVRESVRRRMPGEDLIALGLTRQDNIWEGASDAKRLALETGKFNDQYLSIANTILEHSTQTNSEYGNMANMLFPDCPSSDASATRAQCISQRIELRKRTAQEMGLCVDAPIRPGWEVRVQDTQDLGNTSEDAAVNANYDTELYIPRKCHYITAELIGGGAAGQDTRRAGFPSTEDYGGFRRFAGGAAASIRATLDTRVYNPGMNTIGQRFASVVVGVGGNSTGSKPKSDGSCKSTIFGGASGTLSKLQLRYSDGNYKDVLIANGGSGAQPTGDIDRTIAQAIFSSTDSFVITQGPSSLAEQFFLKVDHPGTAPTEAGGSGRDCYGNYTRTIQGNRVGIRNTPVPACPGNTEGMENNVFGSGGCANAEKINGVNNQDWGGWQKGGHGVVALTSAPIATESVTFTGTNMSGAATEFSVRPNRLYSAGVSNAFCRARCPKANVKLGEYVCEFGDSIDDWFEIDANRYGVEPVKCVKSDTGEVILGGAATIIKCRNAETADRAVNLFTKPASVSDNDICFDVTGLATVGSIPPFVVTDAIDTGEETKISLANVAPPPSQTTSQASSSTTPNNIVTRILTGDAARNTYRLRCDKLGRWRRITTAPPINLGHLGTAINRSVKLVYACPRIEANNPLYGVEFTRNVNWPETPEGQASIVGGGGVTGNTSANCRNGYIPDRPKGNSGGDLNAAFGARRVCQKGGIWGKVETSSTIFGSNAGLTPGIHPYCRQTCNPISLTIDSNIAGQTTSIRVNRAGRFIGDRVSVTTNNPSELSCADGSVVQAGTPVEVECRYNSTTNSSAWEKVSGVCVTGCPAVDNLYGAAFTSASNGQDSTAENCVTDFFKEDAAKPITVTCNEGVWGLKSTSTRCRPARQCPAGTKFGPYKQFIYGISGAANSEALLEMTTVRGNHGDRMADVAFGHPYAVQAGVAMALKCQDGQWEIEFRRGFGGYGNWDLYSYRSNSGQPENNNVTYNSLSGSSANDIFLATIHQNAPKDIKIKSVGLATETFNMYPAVEAKAFKSLATNEAVVASTSIGCTPEGDKWKCPRVGWKGTTDTEGTYWVWPFYDKLITSNRESITQGSSETGNCLPLTPDNANRMGYPDFAAKNIIITQSATSTYINDTTSGATLTASANNDPSRGIYCANRSNIQYIPHRTNGLKVKCMKTGSEPARWVVDGDSSCVEGCLPASSNGSEFDAAAVSNSKFSGRCKTGFVKTNGLGVGQAPEATCKRVDGKTTFTVIDADDCVEPKGCIAADLNVDNSSNDTRCTLQDTRTTCHSLYRKVFYKAPAGAHNAVAGKDYFIDQGGGSICYMCRVYGIRVKCVDGFWKREAMPCSVDCPRDLTHYTRIPRSDSSSGVGDYVRLE